MKTLRRLLLTTSLAAAACGVASANSINALSTPNTFGPSNTDLNYSLSLPDFNPGSNGVPTNVTLTGAKIYFFAQETISTLTLTNTSSSVQTFTFQTSSNVTSNSSNSANQADSFGVNGFESSDESLVFTTGSITLGPGGLPACPTRTPSASCSSVGWTPPSLILSNIDHAKSGNSSGNKATGNLGLLGLLENITGSDLGHYIGTGNFTLGGSTKTGTTFFGGGGNLGSNQATQAQFSAEIDYTYTVNTGTPEPATMGLLGSALVGLGLLGRRFRKRKS